MKKLMILAAAGLAAAFANAASVDWAVSDVYDVNGDWLMDTPGYSVTITCLSDTTGTYTGQTWSDVMEWGGGYGNIGGLGNDGQATGVLVFSATGYGPEGKTLDMGTATVNADNAGSNYTAIWQVNNSADDWKAVPEPTSGMLLLLGVAGLALRRRRA